MDEIYNLAKYHQNYGVSFNDIVEKLLDSQSVEDVGFGVALREIGLTPESGILDMTSRKWQNLSGHKQMRYAKEYQEWYAENMGVETDKAVMVSDDISVVLKLIPPGIFLEGSHSLETGRYDTEGPISVRIDEPYWMGRFQITQAVYERVMGNNPSYFYGSPDLPVDSVSMENILQFCAKTGLRLPTATLWEYAARAGSTKAYVYGNNIDELPDYAWYNELDLHSTDYFKTLSTHPVGQKLPNAWGLYDVHGNVWEWCDSLYEPQKIRTPSRFKTVFGDLPKLGKSPEKKIKVSLQIRGGDFFTKWEFCRLAHQETSGFEVFLKGFRVWSPFEGNARRLPQPKEYMA